MKNKKKTFLISLVIVIILLTVISVLAFLFFKKSLKVITLRVNEVNEEYITGNDDNNIEYKVYINKTNEYYVSGKKMNLDNADILLYAKTSVEFYTNIFNSNTKEIRDIKKISISGIELSIIAYLELKGRFF